MTFELIVNVQLQIVEMKHAIPSFQKKKKKRKKKTGICNESSLAPNSEVLACRTEERCREADERLREKILLPLPHLESFCGWGKGGGEDYCAKDPIKPTEQIWHSERGANAVFIPMFFVSVSNPDRGVLKKWFAIGRIANNYG